MNELRQRVLSGFKNIFNEDPTLFIAPGRINLLGEHVDYNHGSVLPSAINKEIILAVLPSHDDNFTIVASDINETVEFTTGTLKANVGWSSYLMGVVQGFVNHGAKISGLKVFFESSIPVGAGLSSSAALCCGFACALNETYQLGLDKREIALIAQFAEHEFAGVKCGIMDQYAVLFSKRDHCLHLDCETLEHQWIPFELNQIEILLINTKVKHDLVSSAYNERRQSCEEGVEIINNHLRSIKSLRDISRSELDVLRSKFDPITFNRCLFVVEEMERVQRGIELLKKNKIIDFGTLMYRCHTGLQHLYEVSCAELDFLVELAQENKVIGARMMGGGFGGCTINLIQQNQLQKFKDLTTECFEKKFGREPEFYTVKISDGVVQGDNFYPAIT